MYRTGRPSDVSNRSNRLWLRAMDTYDARFVEGSEGGGMAAFSSDGRWIAFTRVGETMPVRKAPVGGGPAVTICEHAPTALQDLAWVDDRTLVVCGDGMSKMMFVLSAEGGDLRPLKLIGLPENVVSLNSVSTLLPGGRSVLVSAGVESGAKGYHDTLFSADVDSGQVRQLVERGGKGQVVGRDLILFSRADSLLGQRFDPGSMSPTGSITPLLSGLRSSTAWSAWDWMVTREGTLIYRSGGVQGRNRRLAVLRSDGQVKPLGTVSGAFIRGVMPSPDGSLVACVLARENMLFTLGVYDVASDRMTMLPTGELDADQGIVWTRDGRSLFFPALTKGRSNSIYQIAADGSTPPRVVHECSLTNGWPMPALLADAAGEWLVVTDLDNATQKADWLLVPVAGGLAQTLVKGMDLVPYPGSASPDGKWMACGSFDAEKFGVSVFPMPVPGQTYLAQSRRRIATEGSNPIWSSDGKTLFYTSANSLMAVEFKPNEAEPTPAGAAKPVISFAKTPLVGWPMIMPGTRDVIGVPDSLDDVGACGSAWCRLAERGPGQTTFVALESRPVFARSSIFE